MQSLKLKCDIKWLHYILQRSFIHPPPSPEFASELQWTAKTNLKSIFLSIGLFESVSSDCIDEMPC